MIGDIIAGLDIGTTKICAIIAEVTEDGIDILGTGEAPSTGMRKGVVINIAETVSSIREAVEEAKQMAGCEVSSVYTGISGGHIRGFNSQGMVAVAANEVRDGDIERVIEAARAVNIPADRDVIHVLPQEFILDSQDGIKEPQGMHGVRLEARVHIVTATATSALNIEKCANNTGLDVSAIVLQQLASAEAVLTEDERELGVCLVDIGGGTSDIALYAEGSIVHTTVLPIGGNHITQDIAFGVRTPQQEAERIKKTYGCARASAVESGEQIEVPSVGGQKPRHLSRQFLAEIIEARVEELFELVRDEIKQTQYEDLMASGVVLTGGTAQLEGITGLAEDVLCLPVRIGQPSRVGGLHDAVTSPAYSTAVGLVLYGARQHESRHVASKRAGVGTRLRSWLNHIF